MHNINSTENYKQPAMGNLCLLHLRPLSHKGNRKKALKCLLILTSEM